MTSIKHTIKGANKNVDSSSLIDHAELVRDCYFDENGQINRRPGLSVVADLGTNAQVDGLFYSDRQGVWVVVSSNRIFLLDSTYTATEISGTNNLLNRNKVNFTEMEYNGTLYLFMTNGSGLNFTDYSTGVQVLSGSSTPSLSGSGVPPTDISHVVNYHNKLVINSVSSNSWNFSNPLNPFAWDVSDTYNAEKNPDLVSAIILNNDRLLICGRNTVEPWYDATTNPDDPFQRMGISSMDAGVLAPGSIAVADETKLLFMNKDRRLASIEGDRFKIISRDYDKEIQSLKTVLDATGFIVNEGGNSFYVLNFPTEFRTFVYDLNMNTWYEWSYWDEGESKHINFLGNCYSYGKDYNIHLIGSRKDGKLYSLSSESTTDHGAAIRGVFRTGHQNHGSDQQRKVCRSVVARFSRGKGKSGNVYEAPSCWVRHRDNGVSKWSDYTRVNLGSLGETSLRKTLYSRGGRYYTRQYEFVFPDDVNVCLSGLYEDLEFG